MGLRKPPPRDEARGPRPPYRIVGIRPGCLPQGLGDA
jgi:hypothetical protein